jgi:hypothetical protein
MKLKLQFIIAAFIALAIYVPVAHGQANLTFSGGNNSQLSITLQTAVTYTITNTLCENSFRVVFDEAGNPFSGSAVAVSGNIAFSVNGGAPQSITTVNSGIAAGDVTVNDIFPGNGSGAFNTSSVVLSAGTLTTASSITAAPPAGGSFTTFLVNDRTGVRCSTNGVAVTPTAATVSISGRVMTSNRRGIRNVRLSLTDSSGLVRTATTTSFGYYRFDDVQAGETYILSAIGKRYTFSQPVQVLNITGDTSEVNFIANSERR